MTSTWAVLILSSGIILLLFEIFVIPGFGISGMLGIGLLGIGIYLIVGNFIQSLLILIPIIVLTIVAIFYVLTRFNKTWLGKKLILQSEVRNTDGFVSPVEPEKLLGQTGKTISALRPSGRANIGGQDYNVIAQGVFVDPSSNIVVVKISGSNIYVKKTD